MKAIMITVRLWWFYLTYKGIKKAEIRKIFAKNFKGKIFEYVSKTNWKKDLMKIPEEEREFFKQFVGKVGLCFECDKVEETHIYAKNHEDNALLKNSCLTVNEFMNYLGNKSYGYAIHITKLKIFDKPKEIKEFSHYDNSQYQALPNGEQYKGVLEPLTCAPQSYCYIEVYDMGFIIRIKDNIAVDYVCSPKTYTFQGDKYVPLSGYSDAYVFKNRYLAEKCKEKLYRCVNSYGEIEIIEV